MARDRVATEEPLEVRLHGRPFAVIMRTPGADAALAAGFLLSERVLTSAADLGTIAYCTHGHAPLQSSSAGGGERDASKATGIPAVDSPIELAENIVNVTLVEPQASAVEGLLAARRQVTTNSSCGLCGRLTIESLCVDTPALLSQTRLERGALLSMPTSLRAAQTVFEETGGLHAAGLFATDGHLVDAAEDVGRHNAVDKVVGRMLMREALPLSELVLFVSGRTSFEIVQKALFAGIPIVASVSAPSSLAIELAEQAGITLAGFVRGDHFNIYTHAARIV